MNPQLHEEFVALCALFYSGEISEEEWALLQIHMGYCDSCHDRFLQYQQITSEVIPVMAAGAASDLKGAPEESADSLAAAERRLMRQLNSIPHHREPQPRRKFSWQLPAGIVAACAIVAAVAAGVHFTHRAQQPSRPLIARVRQEPPTQAAESSPETGELDTLKRSQKEVASLQHDLTVSEKRSEQSRLAASSIAKQLQAEQAQRTEISEQRDALSRQLAAAQNEAQTLRDKSDSATADAAQQTERAAVLETQVNDLKAALEERDLALSDKDRMLALDKDFLAHDRDIRDLIGARNLYIADIFDMTESGRTAKPFGRIFYTKDRSLIFYGFDLDKQPGLREDVAFQAWGSGSDKPPVSLGLFYQDDAHKRWVLRCSDAKTLARLNMVFVTVEPPGGSTRPTGKQLLRAYLQIQPNHP